MSPAGLAGFDLGGARVDVTLERLLRAAPTAPADRGPLRV